MPVVLNAIPFFFMAISPLPFLSVSPLVATYIIGMAVVSF